MEEQLEGEDALALAPLGVDVFVRDRCEDLAAALRPADEHVEAPLSALRPEGPEAHGHVSVGVAAVAHRDHDRIALVALHVLKALEEERLARMGVEEVLRVGVEPAQPFELVLDRFPLRDREGGDAERFPWVLLGVTYDGFGYRPGLHGVRARAAGIETPSGTWWKRRPIPASCV